MDGRALRDGIRGFRQAREEAVRARHAAGLRYRELLDAFRAADGPDGRLRGKVVVVDGWAYRGAYDREGALVAVRCYRVVTPTDLAPDVAGTRTHLDRYLHRAERNGNGSIRVVPDELEVPE
jgi:hypothetical protein